MSLNENDSNHTRELRKCTVIKRKRERKREITRKNAFSTDGPPYVQRYANKTNNILTSKGI